MATYNGEEFINEQVSSILQQLDHCDELVVSDNGSTDNTLKILQKFNDPRIKIYHCAIRGVSENFKNAIDKSNGDYIFFCDQDDVWLPGRLNEGLRLLERSDVASVGLRFIDKNGQLMSRPDYIPSGGALKTLISNRYPGCCLSIRRQALNKFLPFPRKVPMHDWWIVLVAMCCGKMCSSNEVFILYRRHDNNVSGTGDKSTKKLKIQIKWRLSLIYEICKRYVTITL